MGEEKRKNLPPMENRTQEFSVKVDKSKEGSVIVGKPVVYGYRAHLPKFDEIIEPGALDGADLSDVRFFINHEERGIPFARSRKQNEKSTMILLPDETGLNIWLELDTERNYQARALYSAVEREDITGMSYRFSVLEDWWESTFTDRPVRHVTKIGSIVEVSAVNYPAYSQSEIYARDEEKALENADFALENARKRATKAAEAAEIMLLKEKIKLLGGI